MFELNWLTSAGVLLILLAVIAYIAWGILKRLADGPEEIEIADKRLPIGPITRAVILLRKMPKLTKWYSAILVGLVCLGLIALSAYGANIAFSLSYASLWAEIIIISGWILLGFIAGFAFCGYLLIKEIEALIEGEPAVELIVNSAYADILNDGPPIQEH